MTDTEADGRLARIRALTDRQRHRVLTYLDGRCPEQVDDAIVYVELTSTDKERITIT